MENLVWHWADGVEVERKYRDMEWKGFFFLLFWVIFSIIYRKYIIYILYISSYRRVQTRMVFLIEFMGGSWNSTHMFRLAVWFQSSARSKVRWVGILHGNYRKKSPCRRAAYDPTLVANLAIALLTVHHGNNPAIPCDPHNAGKRRGHMTSCLLLDSEVEGSIRSMNGDFKASRRGECIYRQGWR